MSHSTPRRVDVSLRVPVKIRALFNEGKGLLQNVSSSGAYVATPMFLLPQARVTLQIVLREERRWVQAEAVVVWENRATAARRDDLLPGYGLRFVALPEEAQSLIHDLLHGKTQSPVSDLPRAFAPMTVPHRVEQHFPGPTPDPGFDDEPSVPPYRLRERQIRFYTPDGPGVYVLSYDRRQEARVGRADSELRTTLASFEGEYAYFYCEPIPDASERYQRECELFHRLGGDRGQLDNEIHPEAPEGVRFHCPVCLHDEVP